MSSDRTQLINLVSGGPDLKEDAKYLSQEYEYLVDDSSTSYSSDCDGVKIVYDTTPFSSKWINYANSYISIPFSIYNSGYVATNIVALKQSMLSLISGIVLTTSNGESIFNQPPSSCMDLYNNMRLMASSTTDEIKDLKEILALQKDENVDSSAPFGNAAYSYINCSRPIQSTGSVSSLLPSDTYSFFAPTSATGLYGGFNYGLEYRKNRTMATLASNTFTIYCCIPLKYLHDFFTHLDFPLLGGNFRLEITMNSAAKTVISYTSQTDATALTPTIKISTAIDNSSTRTRLYLHTIKLPPAVLEKELAELNKGVVRRFTFLDPIVYRKNSYGTGTSLNDVLTQSVVKPYRLFVIGALANRVVNNASLVSCANSTLSLTSFNVKINGSPFFKQALQTKTQQYQEFLRAFGVKDSTDSEKTVRSYINFDDFKGLYCINTIDLSRVKSLLASETTPCYIELDAVRSGSDDIDLLCYIERELICDLYLNGKELKVKVSQ